MDGLYYNQNMEGSAEARFKINGVKKIYFYCNRDGLFYVNITKGICKIQ